MGWAIALKGDPFDLHLLTEQLRSPQFRVVEGQDCYEFQTADFDSFDSMEGSNAVHNLGGELINRLNGMAKLYVSDFNGVEFGGSVTRYHPDGHRQLFLYPLPIVGRGHASASLSVGSDDPTTPPPPTVSEARMEAAAKDDRVARALRLFGYEYTWDTLYKVYEVIEEDVGKDVIWQDYPGGERLRLFHSTANNRRAVGDAARHGHERNEPPRTPMEWWKAVRLVWGWLAHWLALR